MQEVSGRVARTLDALGNLPRLLTSEPVSVHGDVVTLSLGHEFWLDIVLEDDGTFTLRRFLAPRPMVRVDCGDLPNVHLLDLRETVDWAGFWPFTMDD